MAKIVPSKQIKLLDLTEIIQEENVTDFESLDMAIHMLFLAGKHSYKITREIAKKAIEKSFDGIIYPSYFSLIRTGAMPFDTIFGMSVRRFEKLRDAIKSQTIQNIALFGRPVQEHKLHVSCINRVVLNRAYYDISFGPSYHKAYS